MLSLKDRLSRLTYREACKLLGPEGGALIRQGGKYEIDIEAQVTWGDDLLKLDLGVAAVTFTLSADRLRTLRFGCGTCTKACVHLGAAFSLILEEKLALGLSAPPPEKVPVESLSDRELVRLAIEERAERAMTEKMTVETGRRKGDLDRLYVDQPFFRKDLSCGAEGMGKGGFVLFVPGFSKKHPGHLQAYSLCPDSGEEAVS